MRKFTITTIFMLLTISLIAQTLTGTVLYVSDGDTLTMEVDGQKERIRFYGIDAPENSQPGGLESKEFVLERLGNKNIEVEITDIDHYNRKIGKIYYDNGKYINEEIIRVGHAWWYEQYAKRDMDLKEAEEYVKSNEIGLWAKTNPIAPWDWRKGTREVKEVAPIAEESREVVHVSKSGKRYHREGCRYLKSIAASYTIEEAEDKGYTACSQFKIGKAAR